MMQGKEFLKPWQRHRYFQNMLNLLEPATQGMQARKDVLCKVARALNEAGILWSLSCSAALYFFGIVETFGDYDILVRDQDFEKLKSVLASVGVEMKETKQKKEFASPYYQQAKYGEVEFDLIAKFWISMPGMNYCYDLMAEDIVYFEFDGVKIPALAVEVQLVLYGYMIGWQEARKFKMQLCLDYLRDNGVKRKSYFRSFLEEPDTPIAVKEAIRELLPQE